MRFSIVASSTSTEIPSSLQKNCIFTCWPHFTKVCTPRRWPTHGRPSAIHAPRFAITSTTHASSGGPFAGDVDVSGGTFLIGATPDFPFVFDNEKWAHVVEIKPFRIARAPVTNGEFLAFVEDGGYRKSQLWSDAGWHWLQSGGAPQLEDSFAKFFNKTLRKSSEPRSLKSQFEHPAYWRRRRERWLAAALF